MTTKPIELKLANTEGYFYGDPADFAGFKYMPGYTQLMLSGGHTVNIDLRPADLCDIIAKHFEEQNPRAKLVKALKSSREHKAAGIPGDLGA